MNAAGDELVGAEAMALMEKLQSEYGDCHKFQVKDVLIVADVVFQRDEDDDVEEDLHHSASDNRTWHLEALLELFAGRLAAVREATESVEDDD